MWRNGNKLYIEQVQYRSVEHRVRVSLHYVKYERSNCLEIKRIITRLKLKIFKCFYNKFMDLPLRILGNRSLKSLNTEWYWPKFTFALSAPMLVKSLIFNWWSLIILIALLNISNAVSRESSMKSIRPTCQIRIEFQKQSILTSFDTNLRKILHSKWICFGISFIRGIKWYWIETCLWHFINYFQCKIWRKNIAGDSSRFCSTTWKRFGNCWRRSKQTLRQANCTLLRIIAVAMFDAVIDKSTFYSCRLLCFSWRRCDGSERWTDSERFHTCFMNITIHMLLQSRLSVTTNTEGF